MEKKGQKRAKKEERGSTDVMKACSYSACDPCWSAFACCDED